MLITKGKTDITPTEAGYDECRIEALHKHFERLMDNKKIQCASYCVSRKGKTFMNGAVGRIEFDNYEKPMLTSTPNRIASITKLTVTVAIMKLIEDGLIRLDMPVKEILPEFNQGDFWRVTIYHLLTHTSGMLPDAGYPDCEHYEYWNRINAYIDEYNPDTDGEFNWINAALQAGVRKNPDEEWMYCSFGFMILGEIVSRVSGINVCEYIENEIFKPLGMSDTSFKVTKELAKRHIIRSEHARNNMNDIINGTVTEDKHRKYWGLIPRTDNGVVSTPADLVKFGNMCINKGRLGDVRIVGRKIFERFTTRAIYGKPNYAWNVNVPDRAFGIGFDMKRECEYVYSEGSFFHEGAGACALIMDPAEEMVAAYFVPFDDVPDGWCQEAVYNTQIVIWSGLL